jgi:integrase
MKATNDYVKDFRNKVHLYYSHKGSAFRHNLKIDYKERNKTENSKMINAQVEKLKAIIFDYNLKNSTNPPVEYLKSKFFTTEISKNDILEIYDNFTNEINNIKAQSILPYISLKQNIIDYISKYHYTNIDEKFIDDFIEFLYSKHYNYNIETLRKKAIYFKKFISFLKEKKIINFDPVYKKQEKKNVDKNVETLTKEELNFLIEQRKTETKYKKCLDMFIFQCFTSLRYSDLIQITKNKIVKNKIELISKKTGSKIQIYLNTLLNDILNENKYDFNVEYHKYSNQLKEMFKDYADKLPSLKEQITITKQISKGTTNELKYRYECFGTHTGRRVFITIQIRLNTNFADIMAMTGHKSLEILQEYLDIYNKEKANEDETNYLSNKMLDYLKQ